LEGVNGGISPQEPDLTLLAKAKEEGEAYKRGEKLFWNQGLNKQNHLYLERAARFPVFLSHVLNHPELKQAFFEWILRDRLPPEPYIEFPGLCEEIITHLLTGRIGTLGGDKLKVQKFKKEHALVKVLTLPFEGRDTSLLDMQHKIHFRGGYTLSIQDVFTLFKDKPRRFVDVEYFAQGVMNWNAQHLGYWIPKEERYSVINLDQDAWWRQLPPLEIMTIEEARERYGSWVSGLNWAVAAKAARQHCNLNVEKCHAYLEIAVPFRDGSYYVYDFGKFARHFPYGVVDNMRMFTITTPATIAYPDENIYHTARQQAGYAFEMNHYQGLILMEEIRQDIERARSGNMIFQIEAENCAYWIQTHLEEILGKESVPNLFRAKLSRSEAQGLLGRFLNFVRTLPSVWQAPMLMLIHYPFGPWRGQYVIERNGERVFKSLNRTEFWKDIIVYMPAFLHYQLEKGTLLPNLSYEDLQEAIEKSDSTIELVDKKQSE
jgi:hypothetical protein